MFKLLKKSKKSQARLGKLKTTHGEIETPFFMPDATRGFVKSLDYDDLLKIGVGPMVVNTYHLSLQPGAKLIKKFGGIHRFMNSKKPLLSDSGGYQVFSLIHKNPGMGKISDKSVIFKSPLDGSRHEISPEKSMQIQFDLGVDMMVVLDDVPPNNYPKEKIQEAVERTISWAKRCKIEYEKQLQKRKIAKTDRPLIFGVIQGGGYADLRKYCAKELVKIGFDGYGFGARHIDASGNFMTDVVRQTAELIPESALRFALGVGMPEDIVRFAKHGWDMFDCVIPTREARHGRLYIKKTIKQKNNKTNFNYKTVNISNAKYRNDFSPINDTNLKHYTKAYLYHLFKTGEPLGMRLATLNNLDFYLSLMKNIRKEIKNGSL